MTKVEEILRQTTVVNGIVETSTGSKYPIEEFIKIISEKMRLTKAQRIELESAFTKFLKPQTEDSKYIEKLIKKYKITSSDGVYMFDNKVMTLEDIYRFMWREERLLPSNVIDCLEEIEKISEKIDLQHNIYEKIKVKAIKGKSLYLESLDKLYPGIDFREILYNILVPDTKPLFHILYDDGVGGTGKSTLLEILTKIVGPSFTSNVLLDQFDNRFIFSNMLGKYLNIGDDNGKNDELSNVGTLKSIITGNRITIDRKNISPIEVRIFAKQLFATNILPYIDFTDGGIMRRLNIIPMNKVIPKTMKLPNLDNEELGHIVYEILNSKDLEDNSNELAITCSVLYRFYLEQREHDYKTYKEYCVSYGFRQMNIINFENKMKFINHYLETKENDFIEIPTEETLPF